MANKKVRARTSGKNYGHQSSIKVEGKGGLPKQLEREGHLYLSGTIEKQAHGFFHVQLENDMTCLCTARRMQSRHISLMLGDKVVVEIPLLGMSPGETLKGRIVWRHR